MTTTTPIAVRKQINDTINSILQNMVKMLEKYNLSSVTLFNSKDKELYSSEFYTFFKNIPCWTYKHYDDIIHVYVERIYKVNDIWYIQQWDEFNSNVVEKTIPLFDNNHVKDDVKFVFAIYTAVYNWVNNTAHTIIL